VQAAGEGGTEAGQVSTAIALGNVVGVAVKVFRKGIIPLQGNFHADTIGHVHLKVERLVDCAFVLVEVGNKGFQATLVGVGLLASAALVLEVDVDPGVQESQLAQPFAQQIKVELDVGKGFR